MMLSIRLNLGVAALIVLMVLPLFGGCSAMDAAKPAASDGAIIDADAGLGEGYEIPSEREDIGVETGIDLMDGIDGEIQLVPPLLQKRLKEAKAGETVSLSPATNGVPLVIEVDEPLIIKAGVTLANKGTGEITIKAPAKGGCFRVETDAEVPVPTVIKGLACEVTRGAGLIVRGSGEFRGEELQFQVKAGVGVAIEGVKHVTLKNVQITGEQLAGDRKVAFPLLATDRPLIGLIASHVQMLDIESVEVDGFTGIGALLYETTSTWTTGSVANTVGVDVFVHGGKATLNGLSIATNLASNNPLLLAAGLVVSGGATVETTKLTIKDNEGAGIVADHATMKHDDLLVAENQRFGVRLQDGAVATFNRATIEANRGVGLFVRRAESVTLLASKIAKTRPLSGRLSRLHPRPRFGDGLQLVIPTTDAASPPWVVFQGVDLRDNTRAACLFHGPSGLSPRRPFSINNVSLSGGLAQTALSGGWGLVVQGGMTASSAWGFAMAPSLAEVSPPAATLEVATNLAIPGLAGLQNPLIGEKDGLIRTDGTVYIQIGGKGLDPGRGP